MYRSILASTIVLSLYATGWTLPLDPSTVHGQVQVQTISPNMMQILQSSPQAIVNWSQFNIQLGETVRFLQPDAQAAILNRVTGIDPSTIQGMLQANGKVFLLNPNGIVFGPNATIDVGSFTASTLKMSNADFISGDYKLTQDAGLPLASISNQGQIRVADGGFVVLTAPKISNQGLIMAQSGTVHLEQTERITFSVDGQGKVQFAMPESFSPNNNLGGTILLAPQQMSDVFGQVVSNPGVIEARVLAQTMPDYYNNSSQGYSNSYPYQMGYSPNLGQSPGQTSSPDQYYPPPGPYNNGDYSPAPFEQNNGSVDTVPTDHHGPYQPPDPPPPPEFISQYEHPELLSQSNLSLGNLGSFQRMLSGVEREHFTTRMDSLHNNYNDNPFSPTMALVLPGGPPVVPASQLAQLRTMLGADVAGAINTMVAQELGYIWEVRYWRNLTERLIIWEDKE